MIEYEYEFAEEVSVVRYTNVTTQRKLTKEEAIEFLENGVIPDDCLGNSYLDTDSEEITLNHHQNPERFIRENISDHYVAYYDSDDGDIIINEDYDV